MGDGTKIGDETLRDYSRDELDSLNGVITYAERMIYGEGQHHPYAEEKEKGDAIIFSIP